MHGNHFSILQYPCPESIDEGLKQNPISVAFYVEGNSRMDCADLLTRPACAAAGLVDVTHAVEPRHFELAARLRQAYAPSYRRIVPVRV
jgi:hypothetical protein